MTGRDQSAQDEPNEWVVLGARLRQVREYLDLSQVDVSVATGIPRSAISDIERGQRKVDSLELKRFAKVYRYPVGYLLGEQTPEQESATVLARTVTDLTGKDQEELLRFAEYLRFSARADNRQDGIE